MPSNAMFVSGAQIVSNLENMAASLERCDFNVTQTQTTASQPAPVGTQQTTSATPPTNNRRKATSARPNKSKRSKQAAETTEINVADIRAMDKTPFELRFLAEKHAQSGLTHTILKSIISFHEEIQTMIAIKALELGTTVSIIEEVFGKYMGVRRPSAWNGYLQSDFAKAVFKAAGGIGSGEAMKILSDEWANTDLIQRETYRKVAPDLNVEPLDAGLAEMDIGTQARSTILQPRTNVLTNPVCLKKYKDTAKRILDENIAKLAPVARANHFELVMIAVSNHIGKHNFQATRNTVGINKAINLIYENEGVNAFPAQLQGFLVGKGPEGLAIALADRSRRKQSQVVNALSRFLEETTGLKHWPWSRCDSTLAEAGYELKLLPNARSDEETFKTSSSKLNCAKVAALEADLRDHMIQSIPIRRSQPPQLTNRLDQTPASIMNLDPSLV